MMYRVIVILIGALALAACSSSSNPDWMKSPDWMKAPDWSKNADWFTPTPVKDTVRFESQPPGAEAKVSNGQSCRTPCALALPISQALTVTFALNGYQAETEKLELIVQTGNPTSFQPNPVVAELTPAPRPTKKAPPAKKGAPKPVAAAPKPTTTAARPATATGTAPPPMMASPAQQSAPAPWPSTPPPQR